MNITLISVSGRLACDGSRLISSILKRAGHKVMNIYLARREPDYEMSELEKLTEILRDTDLVMLAVYSNYYYRAVQITDLVHQHFPGLKVVWGGPHCIATPELSLKFADIVCFSEGDEAVLQLVEKMESGKDYFDVPNMAFNVNMRNIINQTLPPFIDLDNLPYYDYSLDDQFLLDGNLLPLTIEKLKNLTKQYPFYVPTLYFLTSRGCPHTCSYCNNCRYISMFRKNLIRFYSVDRIIQEIKYTLTALPFVEFIVFGDDDFLARPKNQIADFAARFKKEIHLPFGAAASAQTYTRNKMEILLDCGLTTFNIGIQSGSQRVLTEVYNRKISLDKTTEVIKDIALYADDRRLTVLVDFIIDNPYETKEDINRTYQFLLDLHPSFKPNLFYLSFYPGTPIYQRARKDGIVQEFEGDLFRSYTGSSLRFQKNFETFLILLLRIVRIHPKLRKIPKKVFEILGSRPVRKLASFLPDAVFEKGADALQIKQAWKKKAIV